MTRQSHAVRFDEDHIEVREFPRIPLEEKSNVWLSKLEIAKNRQAVKDEFMMEQTRHLVQAKLVEQFVIDDSADQDGLIHQAQILQTKLDDIMRGTKEDILAFLESDGGTVDLNLSTPHWIPNEPEDDKKQDTMNWIDDSSLYWSDLPSPIQRAARDLGYSQHSWDESLHIEAFERLWSELSPNQQAAARKLGYTQAQWDRDAEPRILGSSPDYVWGENDEHVDSDNSPMDERNDHSGSSDDEAKIDEEYNDNDIRGVGVLDKAKVKTTLSSQLRDKKMENPEPDMDEFMSNFLTFPESTNEVIVDAPAQVEQDSSAFSPEEEFMSNFLADTDPLPNQRPRKIQQSYIPSDDEFDFDVEGSKNTVETTSLEQPVAHSRDDLQRKGQEQETTPLLGGATGVDTTDNNAPSSSNSQRSTLFHRVIEESRGVRGDHDNSSGAPRRKKEPTHNRNASRFGVASTITLVGVSAAALLWLHRSVKAKV